MHILCAGLAMCDLLLKPIDADILTQECPPAERIQLSVGGDALNAAMGIAALGGKPGLLARIGADDLGRYLRLKVQEAGIDDSRLLTVETPTSANGVLIRRNGDRSFLSFIGACQSIHEADFTDECLEGVDLLYIGSAFQLPGLDGEGMANVMKKAREKGIKTALDTTGEPTEECLSWFASVLKYTDYFLPSFGEASRLTGCDDAAKAARKLCELGAGCVAIKLGEQGSIVLDQGEIYNIAAYPAKVIDTTGAGDSFVAGFLRGLQLGKKPVECAMLGSAMGSLAVENFGASGYAVSEEEIARRIELIEQKSFCAK